jgi:hypothetical protein
MTSSANPSAATVPAGTNAVRARGRLTVSRLAWAALLALAAFPLIGATLDLVSDQHDGIPSDHTAAFHALSGMTVSQAKAAVPGILSYAHQLEVGYAVHELVFGLLLIAVIAIPLRQRQRWAWFACWTILIADVTYAATFGSHDPAILRESLIGAIGMPALLLALIPSVFRRSADSDNAAALPTV